MSETITKRSDEFHVYVSRDDTTFFLADDGCFVPELGKARSFASWDDACAVLDAMVGDRDLGKDEPGIVANAWKRHGP